MRHRLALIFVPLVAILAALLAVGVAAPGVSADEPGADARLVVHEWGTFTSIAGADGKALEWRPLAGEDDLPSFVYRIGGKDRGEGLRVGRLCSCHSCTNVGEGAKCATCGHQGCLCKACKLSTVRMETPVLYFYADRPTEARVAVRFPAGQVTEWYPQARDVDKGIDWGLFKILPGAEAELPTEPGESHYYPARETDAALVRVCGENGNQLEKFLFYRGVGDFDLSLEATLVDDGATVTLDRREGVELGAVILFENQGGRVGWRVVPKVDGPTSLARPTLERRGIDELLGELESVLVAEGLYEKEAKAMIATWRDSWFEDGLRAIYVVPTARTDAILPIEIQPKPAELVRVLVGRLELITPEMRAEVREAARARIAAAGARRTDGARDALHRYGRFAEPIVQEMIAAERDAGTRKALERLLRPASD